MANYAVLDTNDTVVNIIVADNIQIAQMATNATCVEILEEGSIVIGSKRVKDKWTFPEGHFPPVLSPEEMQAIAKANKLITE